MPEVNRGGTAASPAIRVPTLACRQQIKDLIDEPKKIDSRTPSKGYREENANYRCDLVIYTTSKPSAKFEIFIRQSMKHIENFSIGLRYHTNDQKIPTITLVRYNGPHGEYSLHPDGHYAKPHIHRITEQELKGGYIQPQEKHREITNRYQTFDEALITFFNDVNVLNYKDYFTSQRQLAIFDEHSIN